MTRENERLKRVALMKADAAKGKKKKKKSAPRNHDVNERETRSALSSPQIQAAVIPPQVAETPPQSNTGEKTPETEQVLNVPSESADKPPSAHEVEPPATPEDLQQGSPAIETPPNPTIIESSPIETSSSPLPSSYDKRMPPPSPDWRSSLPIKKRKRRSQGPDEKEPEPPPAKKVPWTSEQIVQNLTKWGIRISELDDPIYKMVQAAQKPNAPAAKGSMITGKRDQRKMSLDDEIMGEDEREISMEYLRDGDDRIGVLPEGWKEVQDSSPEETSRKRSREGEEEETTHAAKKRKLKSEYCPARNTTWKPAWIDSIQCYPVNEKGEDMTEVKQIQGDGIHRNAERLQHILEMECMYIPSHQVDDLLSIARETVKSLEQTKEYYANENRSKIRIERHEFK
jgi:hypothetical protein